MPRSPSPNLKDIQHQFSHRKAKQSPSTSLNRSYSQTYVHLNNGIYMGDLDKIFNNSVNDSRTNILTNSLTGQGLLMLDQGAFCICNYYQNTLIDHCVILRNNSITSVLYHGLHSYDVVYKAGHCVFSFNVKDQIIFGVATLQYKKNMFKLKYKNGVLVSKEKQEYNGVRNKSDQMLPMHRDALKLQLTMPYKASVIKNSKMLQIGYRDEKNNLHGLGANIYVENREESLYMKITEQGLYNHGMLCEYGEIEFNNSNKYIGELQKDKFHGNGVFISTAELKWVYGQFEQGNMKQLKASNNKAFNQRGFRGWNKCLKDIHCQNNNKWIDFDAHVVDQVFIKRSIDQAIERYSIENQNSVEKRNQRKRLSYIQKAFMNSNQLKIDQYLNEEQYKALKTSPEKHSKQQRNTNSPQKQYKTIKNNNFKKTQDEIQRIKISKKNDDLNKTKQYVRKSTLNQNFCQSPNHQIKELSKSKLAFKIKQEEQKQYQNFIKRNIFEDQKKKSHLSRGKKQRKSQQIKQRQQSDRLLQIKKKKLQQIRENEIKKLQLVLQQQEYKKMKINQQIKKKEQEYQQAIQIQKKKIQQQYQRQLKYQNKLHQQQLQLIKIKAYQLQKAKELQKNQKLQLNDYKKQAKYKLNRIIQKQHQEKLKQLSKLGLQKSQYKRQYKFPPSNSLNYQQQTPQKHYSEFISHNTPQKHISSYKDGYNKKEDTRQNQHKNNSRSNSRRHKFDYTSFQTQKQTQKVDAKQKQGSNNQSYKYQNERTDQINIQKYNTKNDRIYDSQKNQSSQRSPASYLANTDYKPRDRAQASMALKYTPTKKQASPTKNFITTNYKYWQK